MARRRNRWGTLEGGEQNQSMQQYVLDETMADKEHKRWLAHKDAALHATFPTSLELNGITIPIFKMSELEQLGPKRLKERALNMRDQIEATESRFFEHYPQYTLNRNAHAEVIMRWMIDAQVALASALGDDSLTHAAFGATEHTHLPKQLPGDRTDMLMQKRMAAASLPAWSQEAMLTEQQQRQQQQGRGGDGARQSRSPPPRFPWSQHGVNDDHHDDVTNWRTRTPQHQGFSLVPPTCRMRRGRMTPLTFGNAASRA